MDIIKYKYFLIIYNRYKKMNKIVVVFLMDKILILEYLIMFMINCFYMYFVFQY